MHRLFHSLVVCGAGLTVVHCGGQSQRERDQPNPARGGTTASGGTEAASGSSSGGSTASAGASSLGGAGSGGQDVGAAGEPSQAPAAGPSEQWHCDLSVRNCYPEQGIELDGHPCVREADRPTAVADCQPDSVFACLAGSLNGELLRFDCECVALPAIDDPCPCPLQSECETPVPPQDLCGSESICGCALTCILK